MSEHTDIKHIRQSNSYGKDRIIIEGPPKEIEELAEKIRDTGKEVQDVTRPQKKLRPG